MMYSILKFLITVVSIMIIGGLLPGIRIKGSGFWTATLAAVVISILNFLVHPFMVIIAVPITFFTFGLFLLVLNTFVILLASWIIPRFKVDGFWWALLFSALLSFITFMLEIFIFPIQLVSY